MDVSILSPSYTLASIHTDVRIKNNNVENQTSQTVCRQVTRLSERIVEREIHIHTHTN